MDAYLKVKKYVEDNSIIQNGMHIVLGISGGPDSMCMLHMLIRLSKEMDIKLYVCHVNHGIRGEDAGLDESFVADYCDRRNINFSAYHVNIPELSKKLGLSEEETGRNERYRIFNERCKEIGKELERVEGNSLFSSNKVFVAVAHNKNDAAETVLFRSFRGTGVKGLTGMGPVSGNILRPLLCLTREEIEEYLKQVHVDYRIDATNYSDDFSRNLIRNQIIPMAEKINQRAVEHLYEMSQDAGLIYSFYERAVNKSFRRSTNIKTEGFRHQFILSCVTIYIDAIMNEDPAVIAGVIKKALITASGAARDISRSHVEAVLEMVYDSNGGTEFINLPYSVTAIKNYGKNLYLVRTSEKVEEKDTERLLLDLLNFNGDDGVLLSDIEIPRLEVDSKEFPAEVNFELERYGIYVQGGFVKSISFKLENFDENSEISKNIYTKSFDFDKISGGMCLRTRRQGDYLIIDEAGHRKPLRNALIDAKIPLPFRERVVTLSNDSLVMWAVGIRDSVSMRIDENTKRVLVVSVQLA